MRVWRGFCYWKWDRWTSMMGLSLIHASSSVNKSFNSLTFHTQKSSKTNFGKFFQVQIRVVNLDLLRVCLRLDACWISDTWDLLTNSLIFISHKFKLIMARVSWNVYKTPKRPRIIIENNKRFYCSLDFDFELWLQAKCQSLLSLMTFHSSAPDGTRHRCQDGVESSRINLPLHQHANVSHPSELPPFCRHHWRVHKNEFFLHCNLKFFVQLRMFVAVAVEFNWGGVC